MKVAVLFLGLALLPLNALAEQTKASPLTTDCMRKVKDLKEATRPVTDQKKSTDVQSVNG